MASKAESKLRIPPSSTIVWDAQHQHRPSHSVLVVTDTTELQAETENECQPFFVDLTSLTKNSLEHLRDTGLLASPKSSKDTNGDDDNDNNNDDTNDEDSLKVCLLLDKHRAYLSKPLDATQHPQLAYGFVSLDASRPWMMYWCLHGYDLTCGEQHELGTRLGNATLTAMVQTLEACWQSIDLSSISHGISQNDDNDPRHRSLLLSSENNNATKTLMGGGFGGGPGQLAHCAPTYAAVLTLCIIATTSCTQGDSVISNETTAQQLAWRLLERIRRPLYAWYLSLQQPEGGFRMHHDGEIDVRASYTIFCVSKLLNILTPTLASPRTIDYIASCQTYEGGFGGEPFTEAHGGYAYCAVAALQLTNQLSNDRISKNNIDRTALRGWLVRRQMSYEGGFCGRSNKLVDGCYSFWQGGALAILSRYYGCSDEAETGILSDEDPWLAPGNDSSTVESSIPQSPGTEAPVQKPLSYALLFDKPMLQRYILLCAQDVNGGLRDKPSKPRDFYHSCYNLSGLAVAQQCGGIAANPDTYGHPKYARVSATHPCYNIRLERIPNILDHFQKLP